MLSPAEEVVRVMKSSLYKHVTDAIVGVLRDLRPVGRAMGIWSQFDLEFGGPVVPEMRKAGRPVHGIPEDGRKHSEDDFGHRRW
jgi:hypothetical protein